MNELDGSKVAPGPRFKAIRDALLAAVSNGGTSRNDSATLKAGNQKEESV